VRKIGSWSAPAFHAEIKNLTHHLDIAMTNLVWKRIELYSLSHSKEKDENVQTFEFEN